MNNAITTTSPDPLGFIESPDANALQLVLAQGDISKLTTEQRLQFLTAMCRSIGINPLTRPFEFMTLQGRMVIYARKDCSEQLRKINNVSIEIVKRDIINDTIVVTAKATLPSGRFDEDIGCVSVSGLHGEALSNAMMKAITKAKRRVTLSVCGLGFLDESEIEGANLAPQKVERAPIVQQPITNHIEADVEVIGNAPPEHWSELLPTRWRTTMVNGVSCASLSEKDANNLFDTMPRDESIPRMAIDARRYNLIEGLIASRETNLATVETQLQNDGVLADGETIISVDSERLAEVSLAVRAMFSKKK